MSVCLAKDRGVDHGDVGQHVVVNVAAQNDDAAFVEPDRRMRVALVYWQPEVIRVRKRIDVMRDRIAVRELDHRPGLYDQNVWHETLIYLVDHCMRIRCRTLTGVRGACHVDGDIGHRLAGAIVHADGDVCRERCADRGEQAECRCAPQCN